jgi:hypothetical protein
METANFPLISIVIISFNQAGYLEPGALHKVGRYFLEHPETDVLSGAAVYVHENQPDLNYIKRCSVDDLDVLPALNNLVQPSCYFRRSLLQGETPVRVDLHYTMDWELWCQWSCVPRPLEDLATNGTIVTLRASCAPFALRILRRLSSAAFRHKWENRTRHWISSMPSPRVVISCGSLLDDFSQLVYISEYISEGRRPTL